MADAIVSAVISTIVPTIIQVVRGQTEILLLGPSLTENEEAVEAVTLSSNEYKMAEAILSSVIPALIPVIRSQTENMVMGSTSYSLENVQSVSLGDSLEQVTAAIGGAVPSIQTETMDPRLYKAAVEGNIDVFNDHRENLQLLLSPSKNTVLHIHITAQRGTTEESAMDFVENILDMCESLLLQQNSKGDTPLHMAARHGRSLVAEVLIERAKALQDPERGVGAVQHMLRMTNNGNDTALHEAVRFNHLDVVKLLTREDPEFSYSANDAGETPLYMAVERGFSDLVSEILTTCREPAHGGPNGKTTLHSAVIQNDQGMTEIILRSNGLLTKKADKKGWTPLHHAAHLGHHLRVKQLLDCDRSVAYYADRYGKKTALQIAANQGHVAVMKELISRCPGCWELVDERGWNVFHFAIESHKEEAVKFLLENSEISNLINEKDADGNTPLHRLAASLSHIPTFIGHHNVDKMALNKDMMSPLDIILAEIKDSEEKGSIVEELIKAGTRPGGRDIPKKDDRGRNVLPASIIKDLVQAVARRRNDEKVDGRWTEVKNAKEPHLIVAALIATVTFAAGFTMPGGYISDLGRKDRGSPILAGKAAFKAFAITDTMAMVLSSSAVFIHLFLALPANKEKFLRFFILAFWLTISATAAMVVAFMTGMYAVLEHASVGLALPFVSLPARSSSFFITHLEQILHDGAGGKAAGGTIDGYWIDTNPYEGYDNRLKDTLFLQNGTWKVHKLID